MMPLLIIPIAFMGNDYSTLSVYNHGIIIIKKVTRPGFIPCLIKRFTYFCSKNILK
ncbi:MAG: hypothetical protein WCL14_01940 [Bacteroidota bacterium]